MKFSSIVGYHSDPNRCGVARFNVELAKRLGVPFVGFDGEWGGYPLISLKWSELTPPDRDEWRERIDFDTDLGREIAVFWHDAGDEAVTNCAEQVFYATDLACPPAPIPTYLTRPAIRLFAFGMAHRMQREPYRKIKALIDAIGATFDLRVSMALHEGTDIQDALLRCEELESVVGAGNLKVLGCLSDFALAEELRDAHAVCAFFPQGVRANNTSVHTAMQAGAPVITNLDAESPREFQHGITVIDLPQMGMWPSYHQLRAVARAGQAMSQERFSWDTFLAKLEAACGS